MTPEKAQLQNALATMELVRDLDLSPVAPAALRPELARGAGADLAGICMMGLYKERHHRYATAAALADDVRRFLIGEPVEARHLGVWARTWRWSCRKPVQAALTALAAAASLVAFFGILHQRNRAEDQWRQAEAARREAVAGDAETRRLLSEWVRASPVDSMVFTCGLGLTGSGFEVDRLCLAEAQCTRLLQKYPNDFGLRVALTNISGRLGALHMRRGQTRSVDLCLERAHALWEAPGLDPVHDADAKDWLATTVYWRAHADSGQYDYARAIAGGLRAAGLLQELALERPSLATAFKITQVRYWIMRVVSSKAGMEGSFATLINHKTELIRRVAADTKNRALRQQLALVCLVLGGMRHPEAAARQAFEHGEEAYRNCRIAADGDDFLAPLHLGLACSPLMSAQPSNPYYVEAVAAFAEAGRRLEELLRQDPEADWLRTVLLEAYSGLVSCHLRAGQAARADQVYERHIRELVQQLGSEAIDVEHGFNLADRLCQTGSMLGIAGHKAAALPLARQAATLTACDAAFQSREPGLVNQLASHSLNVSTLLNQLGQPAESLVQAEQARRLYEQACRFAPESPVPPSGLSDAWQRIAKARWDNGEHTEALAAFRESAAIARQVFDRGPTDPANRERLASALRRLSIWNTLEGNWATAGAALAEREQLWQQHAGRLAEVARAYCELAETMSRGRHDLSAAEQAQRQAFAAAGERALQAAQALATPTDPH